MNFNDYQKAADRTANINVTEQMRLANFGMGLSGEAGEVTDYLKKVVFHGHELDKEKLKKELGYVLWYISTIASTVGITLDDVATTNIEKLHKRYPSGFNQNDSIKRVDEI